MNDINPHCLIADCMIETSLPSMTSHHVVASQCEGTCYSHCSLMKQQTLSQSLPPLKDLRTTVGT